ncbi:MAG: hypothetical protein IJR59_03630 [Firmicutes bacterium]|nr:hypothetical protein [Bacillota bacterium]
MVNNSADISPDIVGYAAKTEQLKAELLLSVANVFKETAMGNRAAACEEQFAQTLTLMLMLANRRGIELERIGTLVKQQARAGLARNDAYSEDHKAVLAFAGN